MRSVRHKVVKIIKYIASLGVAALFIWLVVRKIDWAGFMEGLESTRWIYMGVFALTSTLAIVFRTFRWKSLLTPLGTENKALDIWDSINIGNLVNVALPGAGEVMRTGFIARKKPSFDKVLGTLLMERIWDVMAIVILITLAMALKWEDFKAIALAEESSMAGGISGNILAGGILITVAAAVFVWLSFRYSDRNPVFKKVSDAIKGVGTGIGSFFKMENKLGFIFQTSMVWIMYILMSWSGLKAIPELSHLTMADALFISAIGNLASVIPVPSGMGPYHYLVSLTLTSLYLCAGETGLLYAVLCHEGHALLIVILGILSYFRFTLAQEKTKV